jgi:four helix bundle protein
MQDFRKLSVWEKADALTIAIYKETKTFPVNEQYGLTSQLRRASSSIPTNIAEGCGYSSNAQFARFLNIATGSASEVDYLIHLSSKLELLTCEQVSRLNEGIVEVKRMLSSLLQKVNDQI